MRAEGLQVEAFRLDCGSAGLKECIDCAYADLQRLHFVEGVQILLDVDAFF